MARILIAGISGFLGSELARQLRSHGHEVGGLVRPASSREPGPHDVHYDPESGSFDAAAAANVDAIVNLAGAGIADRRWTDDRKREILESRVNATRTIVEGIRSLKPRPGVLVNASAVGYYGTDRGSDDLAEDAGAGNDFLADVVDQWEQEACRAEALGIRVVRLRFGIVLGREGGALARLLLPFRLGLGGPIGRGRGYWPFVSRHDAVRAIEFAIETPTLDGAVNVAVPDQSTNAEFTRALARELKRPAVIPLPPIALRLALGELAGALAVNQRVNPAKLLAAGFQFDHPTLQSAMHAAIRPPSA